MTSRTQTTTLSTVVEEGSRSAARPEERRGANFADQIRRYRTNQRRRYNMQRGIRNIVPRALRSNGYNRTLERRINPDQQLELSSRRRAQLIPAEVLYSANQAEPLHMVYQHDSDERVHIVNRQHDMRFIQEDSYNALRREGYQHIHIGMMSIRIATLHRRQTGVMALITFRDTRWQGDLSVLGTMEVDLSEGSQLIYLTPDIMTSIHDFYNHIQVAVQTRGYGDWVAGESNLIISRGLVARLTNTSITGYQYRVQGVLDYLASKGIQAIAGVPHSTAQL